MAANRKQRRVPWNKWKFVGQKAPLKLREIWAIRVRLQLRCNGHATWALAAASRRPAHSTNTAPSRQVIRTASSESDHGSPFLR